MPMRIEKDSLGDRQIHDEAYYGAQTSRAIENYPISGQRAHPEMIRAYARIKQACAQVNREFERLSPEKTDAIVTACEEVEGGKLADQFVVDVYQAGAGTSFHMNVNEVVAARAAEILGKPTRRIGRPSTRTTTSTSDSRRTTRFPTALHLAVARARTPTSRQRSAQLSRVVRPKGRASSRTSSSRAART